MNLLHYTPAIQPRHLRNAYLRRPRNTPVQRALLFNKEESIGERRKQLHNYTRESFLSSSSIDPFFGVISSSVDLRAVRDSLLHVEGFIIPIARPRQRMYALIRVFHTVYREKTSQYRIRHRYPSASERCGANVFSCIPFFHKQMLLAASPFVE